VRADERVEKLVGELPAELTLEAREGARSLG
jgi:hypothetical protein